MLDAREITKLLPPPRDDEPVSLRQEIVDEISDHLHCGLRRELLVQGCDESTAKQHVLNKFGDPRAIARKLWFQAMWSKIMTQRLLVGSTILSMVVSIVLVVLLSLVVQQMREQQKVNAAVIEQLSKSIAQAGAASSERQPEKCLLKVMLRQGSSNGLPAEGFQVIVSRLPDADRAYLESGVVVQSDKSGVVECGYVEPGRYSIGITTPWGEESQSTFMLRAAREHIEEIVVPGARPDSTDVEIQVEGLPSDLQTNNKVLVVTFSPVGSRRYFERSWTLGDTQKPWGSIPFVLLVPRHGRWISPVPRKWWSGNLIWVPLGVKNASWEPLDDSRTWNVPAGDYSVSFMIIGVNTNVYGAAMVGPDHSDWRGSVDTQPGPDFGGRLQSSNQLEAGPIEFTAEIGKSNQWTVTLPDDVMHELKR